MTLLLMVGIWLIEHLSPSEYREALCGDLLQQRVSGRNAVRVACDVLAALGLVAAQRFGRFGVPLLFSAFWSTLFRGYARYQAVLSSACASGLARVPLDPVTGFLLQLAPISAFLAFGLAVFATARRDVLRAASPRVVAFALSASHAVLLLLVMVWPKNSPSTLVPLLAEHTFYVGGMNVPLALSLLVALVLVLPQDSTPPRRRVRLASSRPLKVRVTPMGAAPVLLLCAFPGKAEAQAERMAQVEQCTLPATRIHGQPLPCVSLATRMQQLHIHGVSVAVVHEGTIAWARGYGQAKDGETVNTETLFQAGSISKPLSAMAALHLLQQGKLSLDGDVNGLLHSWRLPANPGFPGARVSVRELLTHTAGLTVHGFPGYAAGARVPTLLQVLNGTPPANTPAIRIETAPGTTWNYSGGGYTMLQQVLIDVSGQSFSQLLQAAVLGPIGMTHSTYDQPLPASELPHAASPYLVDGSPVPGGAHTYPEQAAAGLWTTPTDLARYLIEVQRSAKGEANHVLSRELTKLMLTPGKGDWGLGLEIGGSPERRYFSHGGVNEGFESLFVAYTDTGEGAVVMTNAQGGSRLAEEVMRGIARAYDWPDFRETEYTLVTVPPATLGRYVGSYSVSPGPSYVISLEGGQLRATSASGQTVELSPISDTDFLIREADAQIGFALDGSGTVTGLTLRYAGQSVTLPRRK